MLESPHSLRGQGATLRHYLMSSIVAKNPALEPRAAKLFRFLFSGKDGLQGRENKPLRFEKLTAGEDGAQNLLRFLPWRGPEPSHLIGHKASHRGEPKSETEVRK